MASEIVFKRTVRYHNTCLYVSIPYRLFKATKIKPGQKVEITINLISDQKEKSEAAQSRTALIKTPQVV